MSGNQRQGHGGKKRSKSYYLKCAHQKRVKRNVLDVGMKGFLVTCNSHEDQAVRECYNLLNEYADKLYGPEQLAGDKLKDREDVRESGSEEESEEEDIEKALEKEVTALKETKPHERRFQRLDCTAKNCLFIKANVEDPSELGHEVLSDIAKTRVLKSRFALRLLPVQVTSKAVAEDILESAERLVEPYFRVPFGSSRTFSVLFKSRNNNSVSRDQIVPKIGQMIKDLNPLNSCDYHAPDFVVLVEVVCKIACMSVVRDFYILRKYNLHEVAVPKPAEGLVASAGASETNDGKRDASEAKSVSDLAKTDLAKGSDEATNSDSLTESKPVDNPVDVKCGEVNSDEVNG